MKENDGSGLKPSSDAARLKFRAWDSEAKLVRDVIAINFELRDVICADGDDEIILDAQSSPIMQWTGLKDKNGREIYEGDILNPERYSKMSYYRAPVVFKNGAFRLEGPLVSKGDIGHSLAIGHRARNRWEIIGNIYERPDLLAKPAERSDAEQTPPGNLDVTGEERKIG